MSRPRSIPVSKPPYSAIQDLYQALNRSLIIWFGQIRADLLSIEGLTVSDADDLQAAIERTRQANERLRKRLVAGQVSQKMDAARAHWQEVDRQLQSAIRQAGQTTQRLANAITDRQIEAALTNKRLSVSLNKPLFGEAQAQVDKFTKSTALLTKDIGEKAARDLEHLVQDAVSRNASHSELTKLIQRRLQVTQERASLIAWQQCSSLHSELIVINGHASGATDFEWLHTLAAHPRPDHLELVGEIFPLDHRPLPGQEIRCQCGMKLIYPEGKT